MSHKTVKSGPFNTGVSHESLCPRWTGADASTASYMLPLTAGIPLPDCKNSDDSKSYSYLPGTTDLREWRRKSETESCLINVTSKKTPYKTKVFAMILGGGNTDDTQEQTVERLTEEVKLLRDKENDLRAKEKTKSKKAKAKSWIWLSFKEDAIGGVSYMT